MTPAVELVDFATRYKLRTGKLPSAMPATQDEVLLFDRSGTETPPASAERVPQFMGIDLYPCSDATQRRDSLR
jgi:hypothetical protein